MDSTDLHNALVLSVVPLCIIGVIAGYLLAWKSKTSAFRRAGSLVVGTIMGIVGLYGLMYIVSVFMLPFPLSWPQRLIILGFALFPLGVLYIAAKFIQRAFRDEPNPPPL